MAAQQCRESERLHGIICCYIGFAFRSPLQIPDRQPFPALCPARQPLGRPCSMLSRLLGTLPGQIRIIALLPQKRYGRGRYSVVVRGSISPLNYNG